MRAHLATALFAIFAFIATVNAPLHAGELDQLKQSQIWRHCEHYFLTVELYRASEDNYAIKDVSIEFIRTIKRFKPDNEREAFFYGECVNLASGNATQAHEAIQREQDENREFFETARIDAENNSNASRFAYMQQLEARRDLELEVEIANDTFKNLLEIERGRALSGVLRPFGQLNQSLSSSGSGGYVDFSASGGNPILAWFQFANLVGQLYLTSVTSSGSGGSGGFANSKVYGSPNTTIAPVTPASTSASASTSNGSTVPTPGAAASPLPNKLPQDAVLQPAQHLDSACASYSITNADVTMAQVTNQCAEPIVFHWCWVPSGRSDCVPNLLSKVIVNQQTDVIPGPDENEQTVAIYVVCDMSDRQRICLN